MIVGKNGAGKTAILDAVAVAVSTFLLGIDGGVSRSISKDDAIYEFHNLDGTVDPQHQFPVSIDSIGDCLDKQAVKWVRSLNSENGNTTIKEARELTNISKEAQNRIMTGDKSLILPLISYYGTGRLYAQKKEKKNIKSLTEFKRQVGYVDCMAAESNEKLMLNWFQIQTLKSLQEQQRTGVIEKPLLLKTVETAICKCFERISGSKNASIIFDLDTHRLVLNYENAWMLGVCYGNSLTKGVNPENTTCDAHRGNTELTVNPFDELSVRKIKYKADGSIYSDDVAINKDVTETLNLNCEAISLPETRRRVLMMEKDRIMRKCKGKSQDTFIRELERTYKSLAMERNLTPYCGIIISWLESKLKIS